MEDSGNDQDGPAIEPKQLLAAVNRGEPGASDRLWELVYDELRALAHRRMARLAPGQTLQPTALVGEAFVRLLGAPKLGWESLAHFYGAAARAMRNVLVDEARKKSSLKRGALVERVSLSDIALDSERDKTVDLLALDHALNDLEKVSPRIHGVVMLRYFSGLSLTETAKAMEISTATVERDWRFARAWLTRALLPGDSANEQADSEAG